MVRACAYELIPTVRTRGRGIIKAPGAAIGILAACARVVNGRD